MSKFVIKGTEPDVIELELKPDSDGCIELVASRGEKSHTILRFHDGKVYKVYVPGDGLSDLGLENDSKQIYEIKTY